ncbi:MAG: hypothetical protein ACI90V_014126, partial [Bacillariaceae sp.]
QIPLGGFVFVYQSYYEYLENAFSRSEVWLWESIYSKVTSAESFRTT